MMYTNASGWTFVRQLGAGDVEHVRHQLFQVAIIGKFCQVEQLGGVFYAAREARMMGRAHVNTTGISESPLLNILDRNTEHQLEMWRALSEERFNNLIMNRVDMIIMPGKEPITGVEVYMGLMKVWGGRFLKGNFGRATREELLKEHPEFAYPGLSKDAWKVWNA